MDICVDVTPWIRGPYSGVGLTAIATGMALQAYVPSVTTRLISRDSVPPSLQHIVHRASALSLLLGRRGSAHISFDHRLRPLLMARRIAVVHDVWTLRPHNGYQDEAFRLRMAPRLHRAIHRAHTIIVPSAHVRAQLQAVAPWCADRIVVVPWASMIEAHEMLIPELGGATAQEGFNVLTHVQSRGRKYVICVAALERRKNVQIVVEAMQHIPGVDVVLVGGNGYNGAIIERELHELERTLQAGDPEFRIYRYRELHWRAVKQLYAGALAAVQMSSDEGFGLPALEAVAQGVPLIASDIPVFREVATTNAVFVSLEEGNSPVSIATALAQLIRTRAPIASGSMVARTWKNVADDFVTATS